MNVNVVVKMSVKPRHSHALDKADPMEAKSEACVAPMMDDMSVPLTTASTTAWMSAPASRRSARAVGDGDAIADTTVVEVTVAVLVLVVRVMALVVVM